MNDKLGTLELNKIHCGDCLKLNKKEIIKSIGYNQQDIINSILELHVPSKQIDCDPTYSKGVFYKNGKVREPKYKYDIVPILPDVEKADCRKLPLNDSSINTVMFDPPFLATKGKSLEIDNESNIINKRFGIYPTEKELHHFYVSALLEFYRILKSNGILIFKCADKVSGGIQYFSHNFIINEAEKIGYYCKDLFVLLAKNRIIANWQRNNQKNARKFHCYFLVFEKTKRKVNYNL